MFRRTQILSMFTFLVLCLAILYQSQNVQAIRNNDDGYGDIIGIELGETSRAALFKDGEFQIFANDQNRTSIPSCLDNICIKRPHFNEQIAVHIFRQLKTSAESSLSQEVTHAVVAVPAYFNDTRRQSVKDAAKIAGLEVLRLVNEPTAAGIAYEADKTNEELNILVYNLNSNSFDVTLSSVDRGVFEVLSTKSGDMGSEDYDRDVLEHIMNSAEMKSQVMSAQDDLSTEKSVTITHSLSRDQLHEAYEKTFNKTLPLIEKVWDEGKLENSKVDHIILTGMPQYVAKVRPFIEKYFGIKAFEGIKSDEVILQGVARQGEVLSSVEDICYCCMDVTSLSLGIDVGGILSKVIPRHAVIPTRKSITIIADTPLISIDIITGERPISRKNNVLGTLEMEVPVGTAYVISFEVDAYGVLTVKTEDDSSGRVIGDVVYSYKQEDIDLMIQEAEENHEADLIEKELIEMEGAQGGFKVVDGSLGEFMKVQEKEDEGWFGFSFVDQWLQRARIYGY